MSSILRSSLLNVAATGVSLGCGLLVNIVIARLLGPAGAGTVAFMLWLAIAASSIADLGMPQTMLRYLAAEPADGTWRSLSRAAFIRILVPAVLVIVAFSGASAFASLFPNSDYGATIWLAAGLLFLVYLLAAFSVAAARGLGHFAAAAKNTVVGNILQLPVVFVLAWLFGPAGALLGMVLRYLPQVADLPRYIDPLFGRARARPLPADLRRYARGMWLSDLVEIVLLTRAEYVVLGFMLSATDLGHYAVAIIFAGLIAQLAFQLSSALLVGFASSLAADNAGDAAGLLYRRSFRIAAICAMPVALGAAGILPTLLPLVFGEAFRPAIPAAVALMAGSALTALTVPPWAFLAAGGQSRRIMHITLTSAVVLLAVLPGAIWWGGIEGAAIARLAIDGLSLGLHIRAVRQHGGPMPPFGAIFATGVAVSATAGVAFATASWLSGVVGIVAAIGAGALVYVASVRLLRLVSKEDALQLAQWRPRDRWGGPFFVRLVALVTGYRVA
jgi:O-antigen/teichoic acid export membrane protein